MDTIFVPPYIAESGWKNYLYANVSPSHWVAYRVRPLSGEIVMQMGTNPGVPTQVSVLQAGFQYTYMTTAAGRERWVADVNPGPISLRHAVDVCCAEIRLKGPGLDAYGTTNLFSYRPTRIYVQGDARANRTYTLTVYGHIQIGFYGNQMAYAEIIAAFPKVWRLDTSEAAETVSGEAPDPRLAALKPVKPVLRAITLEAAIRAGDAGFEGGSDTPPRQPPKRRRSGR